jgi:hypothetical protein
LGNFGPFPLGFRRARSPNPSELQGRVEHLPDPRDKGAPELGGNEDVTFLVIFAILPDPLSDDITEPTDPYVRLPFDCHVPPEMLRQLDNVPELAIRWTKRFRYYN